MQPYIDSLIWQQVKAATPDHKLAQEMEDLRSSCTTVEDHLREAKLEITAQRQDVHATTHNWNAEQLNLNVRNLEKTKAKISKLQSELEKSLAIESYISKVRSQVTPQRYRAYT